MAYTVVGGNTSYPSNNPYQKITLTSDITMSWPISFVSGPIVQGFNDIINSDGIYTITLPDATLGSEGVDVLFRNSSSNNFKIADNGGNELVTIEPGMALDIKLTDITDANGEWSILPFVGGYSGVPSFTAESSDGSVVISGGSIGSSGGTIDFVLPESINNLNQVTDTGIAVITNNSPMTWGTVSLSDGANISIDNPDGTTGNPTINLSSSITGITSLDVGGVNMTGDTIASVVNDQGVRIFSLGSAPVVINNVTIDTSSNIVANSVSTVDLSVSGSLVNSYIPAAWVAFVDGNTGIAISSSENVASVSSSTTGSYRITFEREMANSDYAVLHSAGTNVTSLPSVVPNLYHVLHTVKDQGYVEIVLLNGSGQPVDAAYGVSVGILSTG